MEKTLIPEMKTINWRVDGDNAVIDIVNDKLLLNKTSKIVLETINGINSIQEIIDELFKKYGEENSIEYISQLVESTLDLFAKYDLIALRSTNEFDGWLQYE